jgi:hypothetical protein
MDNVLLGFELFVAPASRRQVFCDGPQKSKAPARRRRYNTFEF